MRNTLRLECLVRYYRYGHGKQVKLEHCLHYRLRDCISKHSGINPLCLQEMIRYDPFYDFLISGIHILREENEDFA